LKIAGHTGLTLSDFWHKVFLAMKMHAAIRRTSRTGIGRLAGVVIPAFLAFTCVGHAKPRLVPSLDTELVGTDSVVYCPTLQIAWDELKQIVGGPIKLSGDASKPIVSSTAYVDAAFGEPEPPPRSSKPRAFVFDKPFLLTMWKYKATQPYLAVWVASPDVLLPFRR
jgi:hypothetical protein